MTPYEEEQIVESIEEAVESGVTPARSTLPSTCAVCRGEIKIGAVIVDLPVRLSKRLTVCGGCFDLYRISPARRPMD
jgi:hypothetical protein